MRQGNTFRTMRRTDWVKEDAMMADDLLLGEDASAYHMADANSILLAVPELTIASGHHHRRASGAPMSAILRDRPKWEDKQSSGVGSFMQDFQAAVQIVNARGIRRPVVRVTESFHDAEDQGEDEEEDDVSTDDEAFLRDDRSSHDEACPDTNEAREGEKPAVGCSESRANMTAGDIASDSKFEASGRECDRGEAVEIRETPLDRHGMVAMGMCKDHVLPVKQVILLSLPSSAIRFISLDRTCIRIWKACGLSERLYTFPSSAPGFISAIDVVRSREVILAATLNGDLRVMNFSLHDVKVLKTTKRPFLRMLFDEASGRLVTAGMDGIHLWDFRVAVPGKSSGDKDVDYELLLICVFRDTGHLWNRDFIPINNFKQVACQGDNSVELFDMKDRTKLCSLVYDQLAQLTSLAFHPHHGCFVTGDSHGHLTLWARPLPSPASSSASPSSSPRETAISRPRPDDRTRSFKTGYLKVHSICAHVGAAIRSICLHPLPEYVLTGGSDGWIKTFSLDTNAVVHVIRVKGPVHLLKHIPHPQLALCCCATRNGAIRLWAFNAVGTKFAPFIKTVSRVRFYAPPASFAEVQDTSGHVLVWTEAGDVHYYRTDGTQTRTLPRKFALLEIKQFDYSPTSEVLFCLCVNGDIRALSFKTDPPTQIGAWVSPEMAHEGRVECLRFLYLSAAAGGARVKSTTGSAQRQSEEEGAAGGGLPIETLVVGTTGGYLGLRNAFGDGLLYRTAATGVDKLLDMQTSDELSVVHTLAGQGGEIVAMSWSLPSFRPGYRIQFSAQPTFMEVSRTQPVVAFAFQDGHVLMFDTSTGKKPRLKERRPTPQGEHLSAITDMAMNDELQVLVTADQKGGLHFWDYEQRLVSMLRLEFPALSVAFLHDTPDILVAQGDQVMLVPSRASYPPHKRFHVEEYLIEDAIKKGRKRREWLQPWPPHGQLGTPVKAKQRGWQEAVVTSQVQALKAAVTVDRDKVSDVLLKAKLQSQHHGGVPEGEQDEDYYYHSPRLVLQQRQSNHGDDRLHGMHGARPSSGSAGRQPGSGASARNEVAQRSAKHADVGGNTTKPRPPSRSRPQLGLGCRQQESVNRLNRAIRQLREVIKRDRRTPT